MRTAKHLRPTPKTRRYLFAAGALLASATVATAATIAYVYTYDPAGRLTTQLNIPNGICVAYGYDASGNRLSQTTTIGGNPVVSTWGSGKWGCTLWSP